MGTVDNESYISKDIWADSGIRTWNAVCMINENECEYAGYGLGAYAHRQIEINK